MEYFCRELLFGNVMVLLLHYFVENMALFQVTWTEVNTMKLGHYAPPHLSLFHWACWSCVRVVSHVFILFVVLNLIDDGNNDELFIIQVFSVA